MTRDVTLTSGLVGLYMAIVLDMLIYYGTKHFENAAPASSVGLTAFGLMPPLRPPCSCSPLGSSGS